MEPRQRTNTGRIASLTQRQSPLIPILHRIKQCYLVKTVDEIAVQLTRGIPRVTLAYVVVSQGPGSDLLAKRFVETYARFPAGVVHSVVVVCNGGPLPDHLKEIFKGTNFSFFERTNDGWDIGAYLALAPQVDSDLLLCFGESVYFHRAGWLMPMAMAWKSHGPGMYGCYASYLVRPHLNTTAFACSPELLERYPYVISREDRYIFEHGRESMWRRTVAQGYPAKLVTWDGVYDVNDWRKPRGILWRGDQRNCLVFCNHTERYAKAHPTTRANWERGADGFINSTVPLAQARPLDVASLR